MKKKILAILLAAACLLVLAGCSCEHEWTDASCKAPKHCALCGETEGTALGHYYQSATCEAPKTCTRCGETEGAPLGHNPGEWEYSVNIQTLVKSASKTCLTCGETVAVDAQQLTELFEDRLFLFTAEEFVQRLNTVYGDLETQLRAELTTDKDGILVGTVTKGEDHIGNLHFYSPAGLMDGVDAQEHTVAQVTITFDQRSLSDGGELSDIFSAPTEQQLFYDAMLPLTMACNPMLDAPAAQMLVDEVLAGLEVSSDGRFPIYACDKDGLSYYIKDSLISKVFAILPAAE